jgi:anti-anti-sigma factor
MHIERGQERGVTVLKVFGIGSLGRNNVRQFESALLEGSRGSRRVVLDANGVEFFDSDAMNLLLAMRDRLERKEGQFGITGPARGVLEVFQLSGLEGALQAIAAPASADEVWHGADPPARFGLLTRPFRGMMFMAGGEPMKILVEARSVVVLVTITLAVLSAACDRATGGPDHASSGHPGVSYPLTDEALPAPGSLAGPVWLVGIDGATWDLLDPMLERGLLPNLARLIDEGAHGTLMSEDPTISPALWATIATGMPRGVHGVDNFTVKVAGAYDDDEVGPLDRRSAAVWEMVDAAGGRSAVVSWFGSYPAEEIAGVYVSKGLDPENPHAGQVHPDELIEVLPGNTIVQLPRESVENIARTEYLTERLVEDARTLAVLNVLVERERYDFVAAYFSGVDVVQHVAWKHMDASYEPFPGEGPRIESLSGVIPAYYRYVDHVIGRIVEMAPENTTLVLVSDHGAGPKMPEQAYHFRLDELLGMLGYQRKLKDDPGRIDGPRTTAFAISDLHRDYKSIWLNLEGIEPEGTVALSRAGQTADEIGRRLDSLRTDSGEPLFASVEVHAAEPGWQPGDPALTVRFSEAALFARTFRDATGEFDMSPVRLRHDDVSGGHRGNGVLIAHGPAIRPGKLAEPATIYNVAPTVLYLLGLPQDAGMLEHAPAGGGVLEAALDPERLAARPIRMIAGYGIDRSGVLRANVTAAPDPAREASLEKLRSLGYIQ